jgi:hypothetical protein
VFDDESLQYPRPRTRLGLGVKLALLGAGVAAGAIGATAIGASASNSSSTPSASASAAPAPPNAPPNAPPGGHGGSAPVRGDEHSVTASQAATLKAEAVKAVPGGTVYRVETDAGDAAFEAHMTKADGSLVTVKFDKNLKVIRVEDGMGEGDPGPAGQHH